jgi:hypothetical protein
MLLCVAGNLSQLGVLSLRDNKLSYLPAEVGNCKELHVLDVSGNRQVCNVFCVRFWIFRLYILGRFTVGYKLDRSSLSFTVLSILCVVIDVDNPLPHGRKFNYRYLILKIQNSQNFLITINTMK